MADIVDSAGSDNGDDVVAAVVEVGNVDDVVVYSHDGTVDSAAYVVDRDDNDAQSPGYDFDNDTGYNVVFDVWQHRPNCVHNRTRDHVAVSFEVMTDASVEQ